MCSSVVQKTFSGSQTPLSRARVMCCQLPAQRLQLASKLHTAHPLRYPVWPSRLCAQGISMLRELPCLLKGVCGNQAPLRCAEVILCQLAGWQAALVPALRWPLPSSCR